MARDKKRKILIVDDELGMRELLSESLKQQGYEAYTAVDGVDALEQAVRIEPDLILLDVMMPKMDGWATLSHLKRMEKTSTIPIVMLTARAETEDVLRSAERRVVDYFIKPVNLQELHAYLARYIH